MNLNEWLIKVFGEDKAKWIKGVIGGALILLIGYWTAPFTHYINNLDWLAIYTTAIIQSLNIGVIVLIAFIMLFLGKPIFITNTPDIIDDDVGELISEDKPLIDPDKKI